MKTLISVFLGLATLPAHAAVTLHDADAYCAYVESTADAQAAPLLWPDLQLSVGMMNALDDAVPANITLRPRLMAGLSYSATSLWRGLVLRQQAAADCARYRASYQLRTLVERTRDGTPRGALAARLQVLQTALPQAEAALQRQQVALERAQTTLADVHAAEARLDSLRADIADTEQQLHTAASLQLSQSVGSLIAARAAADAQLQGYQADLETLGSWDLSIRGGYDRIEGTEQRWPVYGQVTLSASLGLLAQPGAHRDAAQARADWVVEEAGGLQERAEHAEQRLHAMLRAHAQRSADLQRFVDHLREQERSAAQAPGGVARAFADTLWFDRVHAEADLAYAQAHAQELRALLGEN